jgi:hypothetical protein
VRWSQKFSVNLRDGDEFHHGASVNRKERFFTSLRMTDHRIDVLLCSLELWWESPVLPRGAFFGCAGGKNSARLEQTTTLPGAWFFGCAGGTSSAHLEQISTLPKVWKLGYKAGE